MNNPTMLKPEYPSLARSKPVEVMQLLRSENVGPVTFFKLVSYFGSVEKALEGAPELSVKGGRKRPITIANAQQAKDELEKAEAFGAEIILYGSMLYPAMLHTIHDPPPLLMCLGHPGIWSRSYNIGMVGARNASANGCRFARQLAHDLGKLDVTVISGLARGIDTNAHTGALPHGTVGVIAGGIDSIYPPENAGLYEQMREQGAIISEQPFGSAPQQRNFPARNRIISGMSHGIVVVEASLKSGSLITAKQAADQNREVFAVPGSPMDPRNKGSNQLIRDGAHLLESASDVLPHMPRKLQGAFEAPAQDFVPTPIQPPSEPELVKARQTVLEKLGIEPVLVDELLTQCQLTPNVMLTVLLELELAGRLQRYPGNRVSVLL